MSTYYNDGDWVESCTALVEGQGRRHVDIGLGGPLFRDRAAKTKVAA